MHSLIRMVIPKVSSEWEDLAYALQYKVPTVKCIRNDHSGDSKTCCRTLFEDWLSTDNGAKPKTWKTLLDKLREVEMLKSVTKKIEEELIEMNP